MLGKKFSLLQNLLKNIVNSEKQLGQMGSRAFYIRTWERSPSVVGSSHLRKNNIRPDVDNFYGYSFLIWRGFSYFFLDDALLIDVEEDWDMFGIFEMMLLCVNIM